jgi:hypothetical protein
MHIERVCWSQIAWCIVDRSFIFLISVKTTVVATIQYEVITMQTGRRVTCRQTTWTSVANIWSNNREGEKFDQQSDNCSHCLLRVSFTPVANLLPMSLIPVAICHRCRWYQWFTLTCDYIREFLKKIWNGPNGILWGRGETDTWKKPEAKNLVTLSLEVIRLANSTCFPI